MIQADEVLANLGYIEQKTVWKEDGKLHSISYSDGFGDIIFELDSKTLSISSYVLTMVEIKAIYQKCEELGWL